MAKTPLRGGAIRQPVAQAGQRLLRWQFFAETWGEMRKVNWPSREDAVRLTVVVIAISLAMSLFLGIADFIFTVAVNRGLL